MEDVENKIFNMEKKEISSRVIGEIVMERLKELDQVAYVRFASVYREFKDVNTFMDELKKLLKIKSMYFRSVKKLTKYKNNGRKEC